VSETIAEGACRSITNHGLALESLERSGDGIVAATARSRMCSDPIALPLRVALVTRSLRIGGAERQIVKLCKAVDRSAVALTVILLIRDEARDLVDDVPAHVPVVASPYRRHHPLALRWLAHEWRRHRIDVVHSFLWTADVYASVARSAVRSVPLICSERGDRGHPRLYSTLRRLVDRSLTFRQATAICANSEFGRRLLVRHGCRPDKLRVIRNGIELATTAEGPRRDLRAELGWPAEAVIVGMVSRLIDYKGVHVFVRAIASLKERYPIYAVVVGDGPLQQELPALARRLAVDDRVVFLGRRMRVEPLIKDFDIAALLSVQDTEHCSNSILEYMACEKPVVATNVGGIPELVRHGENGLLVERNDAAAAAGAIQSLLEAPELARRMGRCGRLRIESDFDMDGVAGRFTELWQAVSGRHFGVTMPS